MSRVPLPAVVLTAPGTNREGDTVEALSRAGADATVVALADLAGDDGRRALAGARLVVVAGGFSFADALGSGRLFALELQARTGDALRGLVAAGRPVLGICNGFQVLVRAGLLPGGGRAVALGHNASGRFECRWVTLLPQPGRCVWTATLREPIECPVAHGEGRLVCNDADLDDLRAEGQLALLYGRADRVPAAGEYPANPNGSAGDVAGLCDPTGLVLGLMPHPENHIHPWQHPRHGRGETSGSGLALFAAGVHHAQET